MQLVDFFIPRSSSVTTAPFPIIGVRLCNWIAVIPAFSRRSSFVEFISLRKGLDIVVKCKPCGKSITYRALDFQSVLKPGDDIEERLWRCRHCGTYSEWIRYTTIEGRERESLAQ